ncbi:M10 family metallopeptidase C-terminal domain-containing protein, partial [Azotobacter chroococcum]|nr:M10 family metallopeptidase C-terminal domain-containing protein [Azotobacter chroococcum]
LITDFDLAEDRIDLSGLGFSGLGDGHNGTLLLWTDSESNRTYLKNFDADADGRRFEIALEGDFSSLSEKQLILDGRQTLSGSSGSDQLSGGSDAEELLGGAGRDLLDGGAGDDLLDGGAGRDNLIGGSGADIFRFADRQDSFRNYDSGTSRVDDIVDFTVGTDLIDLSALGYSGLGNGYNGTLIVLLNAEGTKTYLKDREADAQGNHFEIALEGNLTDSLSEADIAFDAADLELLGISGSQTDLAA